MGLSAFAMAGPTGPPAGVYIRSQSTLQPGATFYVSSGTVAGQLKANGGIIADGGLTSRSGYGLFMYTADNSHGANLHSVTGTNNLIVTAADGITLDGPVIASTVTASSATFTNVTINGACTGSGCGSATVLPSSAIAFGSATNTVASDTNTLTWNNTVKQLNIAGSIVSTGTVSSRNKISSNYSNTVGNPPVLTVEGSYDTNDGTLEASFLRLDNRVTHSGIPLNIFSFATGGVDKAYIFWDQSYNGGDGNGCTYLTHDASPNNFGFRECEGAPSFGKRSIFSAIGVATYLNNRGLLELAPASGQGTPTLVVHNDTLGDNIANFTDQAGTVILSSIASNGSFYTPTLGVNYGVSVGSMSGAGLATCGDATHGLGWSSTNNLFTCQSITGTGGGGGSSPLEVMANGLRVSSPTTSINQIAGTGIVVAGAAVGGSTASLTVSLSQNIAQNETITGSATVTDAGGLGVTYGIAAGSFTSTGSGNAVLTEPNGLSGQVLIGTSTTNPTVGHVMLWGSSVTAIDGGAPGTGGGSPTGPDYSIQVSSPGNVALEGFPNLTNNGSTVTFSGVYTKTQTNLSTRTVSGVYYDVSGSTLATGIILANGSAGASGWVLTSSGPGVSASWKIAAGSGVSAIGTPTNGQMTKWANATTISSATAADIVAAFSACSGTQYLGADGACHSATSATAGYYGHGGNSQGYGLNTASGTYCMAMDLPFTLTTSSITVQIQTQDAATGNKFAFGIFTLASVVVSSTMPTSLDTGTHGVNPFDIPWIGGAKTISAGQYAMCFTGMSITAKIYTAASGTFQSGAWDPTTNVGSSTKGSFPNSVTIPAINPVQGNGNTLNGLFFMLHQ